MGGRVCCLFLYLQSTAFSWCRAREEWQDVTSIHLPLPHTMRCGCRRHCPHGDGHLAPAGTAATTSSWAPRCAHAQNNSKLEKKKRARLQISSLENNRERRGKEGAKRCAGVTSVAQPYGGPGCHSWSAAAKSLRAWRASVCPMGCPVH